jgi:pSer/pThr/pTyr-binding forkhead associated (FHA) protein
MASIIVIKGDCEWGCYPLGRRSNVVGRDEGLPIQVLDPRVSRKHMRVGYDRRREAYTVCDLKSRNGVLVNGKRLRDESQLADNTYLTIGNTTLLFTMKDFPDHESVVLHFKKAGERTKPTVL